MNDLCYVETGNRHGQILIFANKDDARAWLKAATTHTDEQIENEIRTPLYRSDCKHWSVFPTEEA